MLPAKMHHVGLLTCNDMVCESPVKHVDSTVGSMYFLFLVVACEESIHNNY